MNEKESRMDSVKTAIRFVVGGLVELFIGAVTNSVIENVDSSKPAKFGAKAGGFLVGLMVSDKVSDYVCETIDDAMETIDEAKKAIEEENE